MEIKVKCNCGEASCPEWAILELQGTIQALPSFTDRLQNLQIGVLCRHSSEENYTLTIGYHELIGTKVALKKPLLVLKKIKLPNNKVEKGVDGDGDGDGDAASSSPRVELDVIGIIRHKILFKTRPKALISKPQPVLKGKAISSNPTE